MYTCCPQFRKTVLLLLFHGTLDLGDGWGGVRSASSCTCHPNLANQQWAVRYFASFYSVVLGFSASTECFEHFKRKLLASAFKIPFFGHLVSILLGLDAKSWLIDLPLPPKRYSKLTHGTRFELSPPDRSVHSHETESTLWDFMAE